MKLFHYATWEGEKIAKEGVLRPSANYLAAGPELVWLTENEKWEPSVQAKDLEGNYDREPSSPERYNELGIPCWKFEVEVPHTNKLHYNVQGWIPMLQDGKDLGAKLSEWHWTPNKLIITASWKL